MGNKMKSEGISGNKGNEGKPPISKDAPKFIFSTNQNNLGSNNNNP